MRHPYPRAASLLSMLWAGACGGADSAPGPPTAGLDAPDRPLQWAPQELYSVGGFDAPEWATFGSVADIVFDSEGTLYILDSQAKTITRVSPTGEFAGTVAGPGEGPGELNNPMAMAMSSSGHLVVPDAGHRGFVRFGPDGEWLDNVAVDLAEEGLPVNGIHAHPSGGLVSTAGLRINLARGPSGGRTSISAPEGRPVHMYSLNAETPGRDFFSAWDPPEPPEGGESEVTGSGSSGGRMTMRMSRIQAFEPSLSLGVLPDGRILVADTSSYAIKIVDPEDGSVLGRLERPVPPTVVDERLQRIERDRRLAQAAESRGARLITIGGSGGGGIDPDAMQRMMEDQIENMVFYPEIPVIEALGVDSEGRIWVQRSSGVPGEDGPTDVITADRRYLGTLPADGLRIPDAFGPNGLIAVTELDEFDVPTIRVLRLPTD